MPEAPAPSLRLDLDRAALAANWRALDRLSGPASAGAAVKADAYGLGATRVVPVLADAGCRDFFVAHWAEAAELHGLAPAGTLSVLHGPVSAAECEFARAAGVRPVLNSLAQVARWQGAGGGACDLMIDTGMNRLGLTMAELGDPALAGLEIDVLHSHLTSADEDSPSNAAQLAAWQAACAQVPHRRAALANSAGIALGAAYHGALTRPGLALYGGVPRAEVAGVVQQVARPMAQVLQLRSLTSGEGVGYNATFVAPGPMRVGVVALGYADGFLRAWSAGRGVMRHGSAALPVLGRVSMDLTIIDLAAAPDLAEGDWVTLDYALPAAAAASGLSQYELLTLLGRRFARG
jgi:alanine racemase